MLPFRRGSKLTSEVYLWIETTGTIRLLRSTFSSSVDILSVYFLHFYTKICHYFTNCSFKTAQKFFLKAVYCYFYAHSHMDTFFYWFSQLLKTGVTLPQYGHIFPSIVQQYVKKPQSLPAHQDSPGLVTHFFASLWVVPGDVIRDAGDVEDFRTNQGAIKHSHIPRYRENSCKLELVVDAILWNTQTSVENWFVMLTALTLPLSKVRSVFDSALHHHPSGSV